MEHITVRSALKLGVQQFEDFSLKKTNFRVSNFSKMYMGTFNPRCAFSYRVVPDVEHKCLCLALIAQMKGQVSTMPLVNSEQKYSNQFCLIDDSFV